MKCPKCGYLGFEPVDRCRNCGYDFSLVSQLPPPDLAIRQDSRSIQPLDDLQLGDRGAAADPRDRSPDLHRRDIPGRSTPSELPLFGSAAPDDTPLITRASPPRQPLAVRRATPEIARLRAEPKSVPLDLLPGLDDAPLAAGSRPETPGRIAASVPAETSEPAGFGRRAAAALVDLLVLGAIDAVVVYFTMQICGITLDDLRIVPKVPLATFLLLQNVSYVVAFTAGGQTLGKMMTGIRVVSDDVGRNPNLSQAVVRALVWAVLAVPAGLGFLTALFGAGGRGLHDRVAGTHVVRAIA